MLGIDVSKATLACTLLDPATHAVRWERTVPNTPRGVTQLLEAVPPTCPWVLEPTGRYSTAVAAQGTTAGRPVLVAPPKRAKAFLQAIQGRAKTDRIDSRGLALYALAVPLRPYPVKSADLERVDQLLAARRLISRTIASLTQQRAELPEAAEALDAAIAALRAQRDHLDHQIAEQTAPTGPLPEAPVLDAIPGVGPITAAAVASCLRAKQFTHPDQFVAHLGLDVRVHDSGTRRGRRGLTKQGDAELRRLLFCCAQATLRARRSPFRAQYDRELAKGLSKTAASCVVARKMARVCWSLLRHHTTFDPDRVYCQPPPARPLARIS